MSMMEIDIFVRVLQKAPAESGKAVVIHRYKEIAKETYFTCLERTQNRSIILASKIAIESLSYSCKVNLYTQNNFGFSYMFERKHKKWVNRDVGDQLLEAIEKGGHTLNLIDCSATEEGKKYQQALAQRLRNI
ncbi:Ribonuclease H [Bacillus sonorensis]|nr:Ribonuclease H [Bacillus sonorensis]